MELLCLPTSLLRITVKSEKAHIHTYKMINYYIIFSYCLCIFAIQFEYGGKKAVNLCHFICFVLLVFIQKQKHQPRPRLEQQENVVWENYHRLQMECRGVSPSLADELNALMHALDPSHKKGNGPGPFPTGNFGQNIVPGRENYLNFCLHREL